VNGKCCRDLRILTVIRSIIKQMKIVALPGGLSKAIPVSFRIWFPACAGMTPARGKTPSIKLLTQYLAHVRNLCGSLQSCLDRPATDAGIDVQAYFERV